MDGILNMKIGTRLAFAFGLVLLLTCAVGGIGLYQTQRVNTGAEQLGTNWLPSIKSLGDIRGAANAARRAALRHVLSETAEQKRAQAAARDKALREQLEPALKAYAGMVNSPRSNGWPIAFAPSWTSRWRWTPS